MFPRSVKWKKSPVPYSRIFQSKIFSAILAVAFFQQLAFLVSVDCQFRAYFVAQPTSKYYSVIDASCIQASQKMTRYGAAVAAGVVMALTRKSSKWLLSGGLLVQLVGLAIMARTGVGSSKAEFVVCQVIQGIGAGLSQLVILVTAQASVIHADVASVTALIFLVGVLGQWFGSSIGSGVWYRDLLSILSPLFPNPSKYEVLLEIQNWSLGNRYAESDAIRVALVASFKTVSKRLCIISTCLFSS